MLRGLYSAATALDAAQLQQEMTAENLAQAMTHGYRQKGLVYETFDRVLGRALAPAGDLNGVLVSRSYTDFRPGSLQNTLRDLDLAIEDDAFFVYNSPAGQVYSRNGSLLLNAQRYLVTSNGYTLQGANGPIQIPEETLQLSFATDGTVLADDVEIGQIQRVRFERPDRLDSVGPTLFRATAGSGPQPATSRVLQGFLETSNVQPAQAVVQLMVSNRYFEAAQRALRAIAEAVQLNTRPQQ